MPRTLLLLALLAACAPRAQVATDSDRSRAAPGRDTVAVREALLRLEAEWTAAHVSRDPAALGRLLADEYVGVTATGDFWPKADEIAMTRAGSAVDPAASTSSQPLDSVRVRVYGDVALMTARITDKSGDRSRPAAQHYYYTSAYVWRGGRWQAVMGHVSRTAKP
ncbi:MAG: nuclear transport factor 2 family protein [Rubrobacteraceae bacterium]|nr:nuclear transport factor 2 family protein [Rubrobacteraceae bacterium]